MSRGVYLLGVGMALIGSGFAFTDWALSLGPGVTAANVRRIKQGMTPEQVVAIIGRRADFVSMANAGRNWTHTWDGDEGTLMVAFKSDGFESERVTGTHFRRFVWFRYNKSGRRVGLRDRPSPLLARLRSWIGR